MAWYGQKKAEKLAQMSKKRIVVLDTETTGISSINDEILQITILDGNGNRLFNSYIRPTRKTKWKSAERVNHITPEMVREAPIFADVKSEIQKILDCASVIVGYNVNFDINFLKAAGIVVTAKTFDLMYEFARFRSAVDGIPYRCCKLVECAEYYSYTYHAHNSEADTEATLYCFDQLINDPRFLPGKAKKVIDAGGNGGNKTTFTIQIPTAPKMNMVFMGILCFVVGEVVCFAKGNALILSFKEYFDLISKSIAQFANFEIMHLGYVLIALGMILFVFGIVRWLLKMPKWILSKIRRLISRF